MAGKSEKKERKKKGAARGHILEVATERLPDVSARPGVAPRASSSQGRIMLEALRAATLGEYEILGEIGRGGMASVYLAHDIHLDRKVAIKVMSPALLDGEGASERFKREARTAGALSHPHIIPIHAVKESGDLLYFVMKYVDGRSLDSVIQTHSMLPIPMVVQILFEVASALAYAHRAGVVHRDVKPGNIMLDRDGWAVVTDFGIAKVVQEQGLTLTGTAVGTPAYMSPEQCMAKDVSGRSDQYSLGIVAFHMITGQLPFTAESLMEMFLAQTNQRPASIVALRPDCPPRLAEIVERMMAKSPDHRWPSLDDVVAALVPLHQADARDRTRGSMGALAREDDGRARADDFSRPVSPSPVNAPKRISERAEAKVLLEESVRPRGRVPWWILPAILIPIIAGVLWVASFNG
jgi:serine/threonine protein kinase